MKVNGVELMKETANLTNAVMVNDGVIKPMTGMTFAEIMWTDRTLWIITEMVNEKHFKARMVMTKMKHWADGYEYPEKDENGMLVKIGDVVDFYNVRGYWRKGDKKGGNVRLCLGATTGYRDPTF